MQLEPQLQAFDQTRCALLDELAALPPAQLTARPRPDHWSILEIVEHLVLAERAILQGLPEPAQRKERAPRLKHRLRYLLVLVILKSGLPVRVPAPAMLPSGTGDLAHWRRLWDENQAWLRAYAASRGDAPSPTSALRHPVAGPISIQQALTLDHLHVRTHTRQIRALLRLLGPASGPGSVPGAR